MIYDFSLLNRSLSIRMKIALILFWRLIIIENINFLLWNTFNQARLSLNWIEPNANGSGIIILMRSQGLRGVEQIKSI